MVVVLQEPVTLRQVHATAMPVVLHVAVIRTSSVPLDALSKAAPENVVIMVDVIVSLASAPVIKTSSTMGRLANGLTAAMRKKQIGLCHLTSGAGPHVSMDTFWLASKLTWLVLPMLFTTLTRQCVPSHVREMQEMSFRSKHMLATMRIGGRSLILLVASTADAITLWLDCSGRTAIHCTV